MVVPLGFYGRNHLTKEENAIALSCAWDVWGAEGLKRGPWEVA